MYKNVAHMGQACVVVTVAVAVIDRHAVQVNAYVSLVCECVRACVYHRRPLLNKAHFYIVSTRSEQLLNTFYSLT